MLATMNRVASDWVNWIGQCYFADDSTSRAVQMVSLMLLLLSVAGTWAIFEKAGRRGWACLVPIYNFIVLLEIAGERWWCLLLMLIPGVNIAVNFLVWRDVAKRFGKGTAFGAGLCFLGFVFCPILGFGRAQYLSKE